MPREWSTRAEIHRTLKTYNDPQRGADVHALRSAVSRRLKARGEDGVADEGGFGAGVAQACELALWMIGASRSTVKLAHRGIATERAQKLIRNPGTRNPVQLARARARRGKPSPYGGGGKPTIITARQIGLRFQYLFGAKGTVYRGAGHYTAGPRAASRGRLIELVRLYHGMHPGGLAYEYVVADDGTIAAANPMGRKSAGVAMNNTGLINVCCPGTTGDRMTAAQKRSIAWLLANAHTSAMPAAHRAPRRPLGLSWRPHKEYPSNSTACPGDMTGQYKELWT